MFYYQIDHYLASLFSSFSRSSDFKYEKTRRSLKAKDVQNWYNGRSIAQADKIGFKTNLTAINPFDESIKVPVYLLTLC